MRGMRSKQIGNCCTTILLFAIITSAQAEPPPLTNSPPGVIVPQIGYTKTVSVVAYNPTGRYILSGGESGALQIWDTRTDESTVVMTEHTTPIRTAKYGPMGKRIASVSTDGSLRIWNAATGSNLTQASDQLVTSAAFSPNDPAVAVGGFDGKIRVLDPDANETLATYDANRGAVTAISYSPDGRRLAAGYWDNSLLLWDATTGGVVATLLGHDDSVRAVSYSPDGQTIVTGSDDTTLRLWDAITGGSIMELTGHEAPVRSVEYGPDGERIASASDDGTVRVWNAATGELMTTITDDGGTLRSVSYSPEGGRLATGGGASTISIWDDTTGREITSLTGRSVPSITAIALSPENSTLASSTFAGIWIWDLDVGRLESILPMPEHPVSSLHYMDSGNRIVALWILEGTYPFGRGTVWDVESRDIVDKIALNSRVMALAYSPNGRRIASGGSDQAIRIWDTDDGSQIAVLLGNGGTVRSIAYSPEGDELAAASSDHTIRIWDIESHLHVATLSGHSDTVTSVAYSPDGRRLASGSWDGTVRIWDAHRRDSIATLKGHDGSITAVTYSPNGGTVASASRDGTVGIWDVSSGDRVARIVPDIGAVYSIVYSPDGGSVAFGAVDGTVHIWDANRFEPVMALGRSWDLRSDSVRWLEYSADGTRIVTAHSNGMIRVWDTATGVEDARLAGRAAALVRYSPDNRHMAVGADDGKIFLLDRDGEVRISTAGHSGWKEIEAQRESRPVNHCGKAMDDKRQAELCAETDLFVVRGVGEGAVQLTDARTHVNKFRLQMLSYQEWIVYRQSDLRYVGTRDADRKMRIRFDNDQCRVYQFLGSAQCPLYPLEWYRGELRDDSLSEESFAASNRVGPKELRMIWVRIVKSPAAPYVVAALLVVVMQFASAVYRRRHRASPVHVAGKFFANTHWKVIQRVRRQSICLESRTDSSRRAFVVAMRDENTPTRKIRGYWRRRERPHRLYVVYSASTPEMARARAVQIRSLRDALRMDVVPFDLQMMQSALARGNCEGTLAERDDLYVTRTDPYFEDVPIKDPSFFFGWKREIDRIAEFAAQGQHVGIFGLRKTGKTSLAYRIVERLRNTPVVMMSCAYSEARTWEEYLAVVAQDLGAKVEELGVSGAGLSGEGSGVADLSLVVKAWVRSGRPERCVIILDEIEWLLPLIARSGDVEQLRQGRRVLGVLRSLAQETGALSLVAIGYRPDINRVNSLGVGIGDNPMFMSFREFFARGLGVEESGEMLRELGAWRGITWEDDAIQKSFECCGGHPFATRLLASDLSALSHIVGKDVDEAATSVRRAMRGHAIGAWYSGVVEDMTSSERGLLRDIAAGYDGNMDERHVGREYEEALTNLENYGVVRNDGGRITLNGSLFEYWCATRLI